MMKRRALFLDRDGTLVQPRHYPTRPEDLCIYPGISRELRRFQEAGFRLVVITNQSGLARDLFTSADLRRMHAHLIAELARSSVRLDGIYHCPHHPDGVIPDLSVRCRCRKPEPGMLFQAAADLGLDLQRSWVVGDILDDIEAGNRAGCRSILVDLGTEPAPDRPVRQPDLVARDTRHALRMIRAVERFGPAVELAYRPPGWQPAAGGLMTPDAFLAQRITGESNARRG